MLRAKLPTFRAMRGSLPISEVPQPLEEGCAGRRWYHHGRTTYDIAGVQAVPTMECPAEGQIGAEPAFMGQLCHLPAAIGRCPRQLYHGAGQPAVTDIALDTTEIVEEAVERSTRKREFSRQSRDVDVCEMGVDEAKHRVSCSAKSSLGRFVRARRRGQAESAA